MHAIEHLVRRHEHGLIAQADYGAVVARPDRHDGRVERALAAYPVDEVVFAHGRRRRADDSPTRAMVWPGGGAVNVAAAAGRLDWPASGKYDWLR